MAGTNTLTPAATERHYTVAEIAATWRYSKSKVRKLFLHEPGVMKEGKPETAYRRSYFSLRIPESVMVRVHRRLTDRA